MTWLRPLIELQVEALSRIPAFQGGPVRRYVNLPPAVLSHYQLGSIVLEPGFFSTTIAVARPDFADRPHLLEVHPRAGILIEGLSGVPHQREVLLRPDSKFQVLHRMDFPDGRVDIVMVEVEE